MGYDDRREMLERLEALERRMGSHHDDRGGRQGGHRGERHHERRDRRHHDRDRHRGGGEFEEKRIIDTIVRLVSEHVECIVEDKLERSRPQGDEGGEKRIVDLIVRLVSAHVQEIVVTELDRRLGPAGGPRSSGGSPDAEHD
jgi:hypothetical protein